MRKCVEAERGGSGKVIGRNDQLSPVCGAGVLLAVRNPRVWPLKATIESN